jgi:hypothetical protein
VVVQVAVVPGARRQHGLADDEVVGAAALGADEELDLHVDPALLPLQAGLERHVLDAGAVHLLAGHAMPPIRRYASCTLTRKSRSAACELRAALSI